MSTSWSDMILRYLDDGETYETIIDYFNHPAINKEYIDTVLLSRKKLLQKKSGYHHKLATKAPAEGTQLRLIYDYAMSVGGVKQYAELLKTRTQASIARELNVPRYAAINFKRKYIQNAPVKKWLNNAPNLTMKIRADQIYAGTYKKKRKRISVKDVRNLW